MKVTDLGKPEDHEVSTAIWVESDPDDNHLNGMLVPYPTCRGTTRRTGHSQCVQDLLMAIDANGSNDAAALTCLFKETLVHVSSLRGRSEQRRAKVRPDHASIECRDIIAAAVKPTEIRIDFFGLMGIVKISWGCFVRNFLFLFSSLFLCWPAWAKEPIRITADQAKCIAENLDTYLGYGTDPVIVVPATCPDPPTNDELMAALAPQNSGSGLPTPKVGKGDNVLILLQSQLKCITRLVNSGDLTQNPDGLVELSLGQCVD